MISSKDISIVVAGALERGGLNGDLALNSISSLRRILPESEIILSTWTHMDCTDLPYDKLVQLPLPEAVYDNTGRVSNFLRQVTSVRNGLSLATREYVLKFRPDLIIQNDEITKSYKPRSSSTSPEILQSKVVLTDCFIPNPLFDPTLFHVSDIVQFGTRADIIALWGNWRLSDVILTNNKPFRIIGNFGGYTSFSLLPEQALTIFWLKSTGRNIQLLHINDGSYGYLNEWISILFDNFTVIPAATSGIEFPKRFSKGKLIRHALSEEHRHRNLYVRSSLVYNLIRYFLYLINKYVLCIVNYNFIRSSIHVLAWHFVPNLARRLWRR